MHYGFITSAIGWKIKSNSEGPSGKALKFKGIVEIRGKNVKRSVFFGNY